MIYLYEAEILRYINKVIPEIKLSTYASDFDLLRSMDSVGKLPSFYYSRNSTEWSFNKVLYDDTIYGDKIIPFTQTYSGRIYLESYKSAFDLSAKLKFYINKIPYVVIKWKGEPLKVQIRLSYIKISEERSASDTKGTLRYIEFGWQSNLFFYNDPEEPLHNFVEEVRIYLDDTGLNIMNRDNLITTIR